MSDGEVKIELDGEEVVLRPTFKCFRTLMGQYGNLSTPLQQISLLNPDAVRDVIIAGTGKKTESITAVEEAIFKVGIINLIEPTNRFVIMLGNGGKTPDIKGEEEDADPNVE